MRWDGGFSLAWTPKALLPTGENRCEQIDFDAKGRFQVSKDEVVAGGPMKLPDGWDHWNLGGDGVRFGLQATGPDAFGFVGDGTMEISSDRDLVRLGVRGDDNCVKLQPSGQTIAQSNIFPFPLARQAHFLIYYVNIRPL